MRRRSLAVLAALAALTALPSCGGGAHTAATTTVPTTAKAAGSAAAASFKVTIEAPTHRPKANAKWPVSVRVTDMSGKPIAAKLRMQILFGGSPVGQVDNGRVYRFVGSWHEKPGQEITWPASAVGEPLTFEAVVTAGGKTRKADYTVTVRR